MVHEKSCALPRSDPARRRYAEHGNVPMAIFHHKAEVQYENAHSIVF